MFVVTTLSVPFGGAPGSGPPPATKSRPQRSSTAHPENCHSADESPCQEGALRCLALGAGPKSSNRVWGSGIRVDRQRGVVFPTDVKAPRPFDDTCGAIGPAGVAARFVLGRIP